jgi:hypothetical protein
VGNDPVLDGVVWDINGNPVGSPSFELISGSATISPDGKVVASAPTIAVIRAIYAGSSIYKEASPVQQSIYLFANVEGSGPRIRVTYNGVDASTVDFHEMLLGTSGTATFEVHNDSATSELSLISVNLKSGRLSLDNELPGETVIPVDGVISVTVRLTPDRITSVLDSIEFLSNDPTNSRYNVSLTAKPYLPIVSGQSLETLMGATDFGEVALGRSGILTLLVKNLSAKDLSLTSSSDNADYTVTSGTVIGGADGKFVVTFTPSKVGVSTAVIHLGDFVVNVTGTGY